MADSGPVASALGRVGRARYWRWMALQLHALTGLRFWLILWVVAYHYYADLLESEEVSTLPHVMIFDTLGDTLLSGTGRVHIAVCMFVTLSGFVTQWAYKPTPLAWRPLALWYVRRLDRVLLSTWLWMAYSNLINIGRPPSVLSGVIAKGLPSHMFSQPTAGWTALCYAQLAPWVAPQWLFHIPSTLAANPIGWLLDPHSSTAFLRENALVLCPNAPAWTVASLIPQWIIFPLVTHPILDAVTVRGGTAGLCALVLAVALLVVMPYVGTYLSQSNSIPASAVEWLYFHPVASMPNFGLGAVVAALAQRVGSPSHAPSTAAAAHAAGKVDTVGTPNPALSGESASSEPASSSRMSSWVAVGTSVLADACMLSLLAVAFVRLPDDGPKVTGVKAFLIPIAVLLFGGFLFGAAVGVSHARSPPTTLSAAFTAGGLFAWRLAQPVSRSLGVHAFEVYLMHSPIKETLLLLTNSQKFQTAYAPVLSAITTWALAIVYATYVQDPAVGFVRTLATRALGGAEGGARRGGGAPSAAASDSAADHATNCAASAAEAGDAAASRRAVADEHTPLAAYKQ